MSKSSDFSALLLGINDTGSMFRKELMALEEGPKRTLRFVAIFVERQTRRLGLDPKAADTVAKLTKAKTDLPAEHQAFLDTRVKTVMESLKGPATGAKKAA